MAYLLNVVYALAIMLYLPALVAAALRKGKYRGGLGQKLLGLVPCRESTARCVWIHAVSLGEVSLIAPLVDEIRRRHADWEIAISTTTVTGYVLAKTRYADYLVFYCPLDFTWAVRRAMKRVRPDLVVLVELELWPNLIAAARDAGARVAIVNGRLSDRSYGGYLRLRRWLRPVLAKLDLIAAQSSQYADRFVELGAPSDLVANTGSLKFDGAQTARDNPTTIRLRKLAGVHDGDVVFLAGSTQDPEERLALAAYRELVESHPELRLVLVPRHPERFEEVARLISASGLIWQRRSRLEACGSDPRARVLLVDKVGELAAWWGTAEIAYVGGSMGKRNGQNMIEPAAYGAAVSFGPFTRNFRDVVAALRSQDAAVVVRGGRELTTFVRCCLEHRDVAAELGRRAQQVVLSQLGATARTADLLDGLLNESAPQARRTAA